ncbi:MAG: hypothetical protein IJI57_01750 [Flexilinea sp.]|nr:hypothetical protein [Flexilinea sp.]
MENIKTAEMEYCTEILKDTHENERIYFTSGEGKEFVLISRKELDLLEKQIAFNKFIKELDQIREENDRNNSWIPEEEAWKMLGIED